MSHYNKRYSLGSKLIWLTSAILFWMLSLNSNAQDGAAYKLLLTPEKCVSLRQGQTCYLDIELSWSAKTTGVYCIFASTLERPLRCWDGFLEGKIITEFSSNENTWFYLKKGQETLAQVELKMAWVYKRKRSPSTWRVF